MKRKILKEDAKEIVLPHSQAKLDLYKNYLMHYLRVLSHAEFCTKINLYDIFCGVGLYKDGNQGSPLITNECIKEVIDQLKNSGKPFTPVSVTINDKEKGKVDKVKFLLSGQEISGCTYNYFCEEADNMLDRVAKEINRFPKTERNLIFIDPYGYSNITKQKLYDLLKNETTEVILFLPINQMYRFTEVALSDVRSCYDNLRRFITTFFPPGHKIHTEGVDCSLDFIYEVKKALTYDGRFYSCSHYIERDKGNYYALFFITSNIYGLEKMVEAKWALDPVKGKGFNQLSSMQIGLFQDHFNEIDHKKQIEYLKEVILDYLQHQESINNALLYTLALSHEFRPSHANTAVTDLIKGRRLTAKDLGGKLIPSTRFSINYHSYKSNDIKAIFSLIK